MDAIEGFFSNRISDTLRLVHTSSSSLKVSTRVGLLGVLLVAVGCSSDTTGNGPVGSNDAGSGGSAGGGASSGTGGIPAAGGMAAGNGGRAGLGGERSSGGTAAAAGGNSAGESGGATSSGGAVGIGGAGTGGAMGSGGAGAGGGTGTGGANAGAHTNPLSQTLIDAFVAAHNAARSGPLNPTPSPALPPVTWDATLADVAYNYLSKCTSTSGSLVDHNKNRTTDYAALGGKDYVGENIYASTGQSVAPADAVSSWMSEASKYDYATGDFSQAGHYTQVVWRTSVRIGCAIVNCPAASVTYHDTILCDYAPGGNYTGQKPY